MAISGAPRLQLRRVLGFRTVLSTSAGLAYAAISFLGCVLVATALVGDGAWLAILIAGALALLAATCFAELNALYPSAAAIRLYMREAFNARTSLIISFAYLLTVVAVIAADSYVVGSAVTYALGLPRIVTLVLVLALLTLAALANLRGIRIAGILQDVTTYALLISAILISVIGLASHGFHFHALLSGLSDPGGLFNAVAAGVFVFSAFEWVTPLSEEVADQRLIPRGMYAALGLLFISYALFTLACTNLLSVQSHGGWHLPASVTDPARLTASVPQMLMAEAALGAVGRWWMLLATLLTGVMTFNGGFATASRFLYAAAREGTLPQVFSKINRFIVPWVAVTALAAVSAAIAVIIFLTEQFQVLILVGAALEAMIYTVAGLCVIQLRRRKPESERTFKSPLGWTIPILTIGVFALLFVGALLPQPGQLPGLPPALVPVITPAIVAGIFILSTIYVLAYLPRLQARLAALRATVQRRRPQHPAPGNAGPAEGE
ncbi:MAG TPA: APC family permease [Ktedonobacterales bacterium]|nr:APC family permease [Ktedonobacterales bacterium]